MSLSLVVISIVPQDLVRENEIKDPSGKVKFSLFTKWHGMLFNIA